MSQENVEDANSYIPVAAPEADIHMSAIEPINNNRDNNEQVSLGPSEPIACPNDKNDSNPTPVNSDTVTLRLSSFGEEQEHVGEVNGNQQRPPNGDDEYHWEYQLNYPITRFTRKWKRPEVQGFCCLAIEIICLSTLAVLGLQAVGYFDTIKNGGHLPLSFSWKILWEFFGNTALPKQLVECLFTGSGGKVIVLPSGEEPYPGMDTMDVDYFMDAFSSQEQNKFRRFKFRQRQSINQYPPSTSTDRNQCEFGQGQKSLGWLVRFFVVTNFMPVLNVITSTLLYTSISVRRRKGMQVLLLLPSFFCFFVSIFQQIPISFQYNYFDQALVKEMSQTLGQSSPPFYVVPVLDETQVHHECCGVEFPESWERFGQNMYPRSCCNSSAFECSNLTIITREHTWSLGCFQVEHERIHSFERWAQLLYALKVIAEVGIFCTLSDLTRFDYPPPDVQETSRCDFRDYQIKCRGVMHIKGLLKDGRIVVESKYFLPWRLAPSRTDMLNGLQLFLKTDHQQTKGSVEVVKRHNPANFLNEDIQIDLSRKHRGIFVFTMI